MAEYRADRDSPDATTYLDVALRWWWVLVLATLGGATLGYVGSSFITPTYQATGTLLVNQQQIPGVTQRNDLETSILLANTFARLIPLDPMLEQAVDRGELALSASQFRASLSVTNPSNTPIIELTATSTSPARARDMVNVLSAVFIESAELQASAGPDAVALVSPATLPSTPATPRPTLNAMLGGALALVAAFLLIVVFDRWGAVETSVPISLDRRRRGRGAAASVSTAESHSDVNTSTSS